MAANLTETFPRSPFFRSLRQSHYTLPIRPEFLASSSFKFANPRNHVTNTDKVVEVLPASAVAGLSDENVLALFSTGFFGGFIFGFERFILRIGVYKILPCRYTGTYFYFSPRNYRHSVSASRHTSRKGKEKLELSDSRLRTLSRCRNNLEQSRHTHHPSSTQR